jgi:hypothetical protein
MKPNHGDKLLKHAHSIRGWFIATLLLSFSQAALAAVQAELDRYRIVKGETVTLTVLTDNPGQDLDADFSALEADFEILDQRSETQLSIVNGRQTAVVRLLLTLEPKRVGTIRIAPLVFDNEATEPIMVTIDPAPELEPGTQPPVFIEVELVPGAGPYFVHAQLGLVVRVFYQQNLTEAAISQPEPAPAAVRLMQETPYQAERGGERYRVLERIYAIFPERSGELVIPPMQLSGRLVEKRASGVWQPTIRGRRIQVESETLRLMIDPKPAGFTGQEWQPARDYQLTQQISSGDSLRVGEPVTRTVIVDAVGLEENMIIEPAWPELAGTRIYPDQPQGITRDDGNWVLGHKEFRYAVVPEREGPLVLPELRVAWWDTQNNRQQLAVLDSHTIEVQPSALVPTPPQASGPGGPALDGHPAGTRVAGAEPAYWQRLTILFATLWLITLVVAWRARRPRREAAVKTSRRARHAEAEAEVLSGLKRACKKGDTRAARRALQQWLRTFGTGSGSLLEFAAGVGDEHFRAAVYAMDSEGFRPGAENAWNGEVFWKAFESWRKNHRRKIEVGKPDVTDLYARENRSIAPS